MRRRIATGPGSNAERIPVVKLGPAVVLPTFCIHLALFKLGEELLRMRPDLHRCLGAHMFCGDARRVSSATDALSRCLTTLLHATVHAATHLQSCATACHIALARLQSEHALHRSTSLLVSSLCTASDPAALRRSSWHLRESPSREGLHLGDPRREVILKMLSDMSYC